VVAPFGTAVVIWVAPFTVKVAVVPLNVTAVAPVRCVPVMVTDVLTTPLEGEKLEIVGAVEAGGGVVLLPPPQDTTAANVTSRTPRAWTCLILSLTHPLARF